MNGKIDTRATNKTLRLTYKQKVIILTKHVIKKKVKVRIIFQRSEQVHNVCMCVGLT